MINENAGAAIATVIGNVAGAGYYILYFLRGKSSLSIHPKDFTLGDRVCSSVLAIGIPASLGSLLMSVSQIVVNSLMAGYGDMALAGIGVAMKVTMMTGMVCIGFGQGIQPLLGYCVGATLWERFKKVMNFSLLFSFTLSAATPALIIYLSRQGIIYIPALFIMRAAVGVTGLVWAQPVADLLSTALVAVLYLKTVKKMQKSVKKEISE